MQKYIVKVEQITYATIEVTAPDNTLAQMKVEQMIQDNEISFTDIETVIKSVEEVL